MPPNATQGCDQRPYYCKVHTAALLSSHALLTRIYVYVSLKHVRPTLSTYCWW